jgi:hypothetical protein
LDARIDLQEAQRYPCTPPPEIGCTPHPDG